MFLPLPNPPLSKVRELDLLFPQFRTYAKGNESRGNTLREASYMNYPYARIRFSVTSYVSPKIKGLINSGNC